MSTAADADRQEAKSDLTAAEMAEYVARVLASAPPLSDAQRESIIAVLRNGGEA